MINAINDLSATDARSTSSARQEEHSDARLSEAAQQFEALLLAQILKSARQSFSGGLAGETDAAEGCAMEYAEEQVAALLAERGGFGIANVIIAGLKKEEGVTKAAQDAAGAPSPAETPRS